MKKQNGVSLIVIILVIIAVVLIVGVSAILIIKQTGKANKVPTGVKVIPEITTNTSDDDKTQDKKQEGSKNGKNLLSVVNKNKKQYYGKKVIGYEANGVSDWRIFYSDDEHVYLITTDCIEASKAVECNPTMKSRGEYEVYWDTVPTKQPTENSSRFSPVVPGETVKFELTDSEASCYVSTLLNTDNWKTFVASEKADYAIGSPTLEMLVASYNTLTQNDHKIVCEGYSTREMLYDPMIGMGLYAVQTMSGKNPELYGCFLASPGRYEDSLKILLTDGYDHFLIGDRSGDTHYMGLRPVVSLRTEVIIKSETDDTVTIN